MRNSVLFGLILLAGTGAPLLGCSPSSDSGSRVARSGGGTGAAAGGSGNIATGDTNGLGGSNGVGVAGTDNGTPAGGACQHLDVNFEPKIPTVYLVVDRSGSVFDSNAWTPLQSAVLSVVNTLQATIRFGFAAFTGMTGCTTPVLDSVDANLNNYTPINSLYTTLMRPTFKAETPASLALKAVAAKLNADAAAVGGKYILFVTEAEPDFCDDGGAICPVDDVTNTLQQLDTGGITTLILGIRSTASNLADQALQAWANAGSGAPVGPFTDPGSMAMYTGGRIYDECQGRAGWLASYTANGHTAAQHTSIATYAATAGTARLYKPDAINEAALTTQIQSAVNTAKSCVFDLQGHIKVDLSQASKGKVAIDGTDVPFDMMNGWHMLTETQLELVGSGCDTWRGTGQHISFDFPCDIIITLQ